jgi:hypothetical protein
MPRRSSSWATCDATSAVVKRWSAKSPMPTARASAGARVDNNIIYILQYLFYVISGTDGPTGSALSKATIPLLVGAKRHH